MNPGYLSLGLQAAGMAMGAVGSFYSAKMAKQQLAFEAGMADINARLSETSARQELHRGQAEVGKLTMAAGQLKARQRTAFGANGVVMGEGSAAEIAASAEIMKEIDKNTIEANAVRSAWGYRTQGVNYQSEAVAKRGTSSSISPFGAAAGSLLSSAGQVASSWYQFNKAGMGGNNAPMVTIGGG